MAAVMHCAWHSLSCGKAIYGPVRSADASELLFCSSGAGLRYMSTKCMLRRSHREEFECFLGEDFDSYLTSMARLGTWGDELTLRAACDAFGVVMHVVTSDAQVGVHSLQHLAAQQ
jgi:hypothetical protein